MQEVEITVDKPCPTHNPLPIPNLLQVHMISQMISKEKITRIHDLLRLEHLNKEEQDPVKGLLGKYGDLFHFPSDKLEYTNASAHKITTRDEKPVNTK
ncbi:hypothetical protein P5V15_011319 [Pogonomyrmex californicus]